jgi:hypothetical protein
MIREVKDELAARRARKGIVTISINGKVVKELQFDAGQMRDPLDALKGRRRRKRLKPPDNP